MPEDTTPRPTVAATLTALMAIGEHGYLSPRYSSPEDMVRSLDWVVSTARAALAGEPLPELDLRRTETADRTALAAATVTPSGKHLFNGEVEGWSHEEWARREIKRKRLQLDPDLTDGEHHTIHDDPDRALLALIRTWMINSDDGDEITIRLREMSDNEYEGLADV